MVAHNSETWRIVSPQEHHLLDESEPSRTDSITLTITLAKIVTDVWVRQVIVPRLLTHPRFRSNVVRRRRTFAFEPIPDLHRDNPALAFRHVCMEGVIPFDDSNREQLRLFTSRLSAIVSGALPRDRPLWALHVFPHWSCHLPARRHSTTVVLHLHHVLGDVCAVVRFFTTHLADPSAAGAAVATAAAMAAPSLAAPSLRGRSVESDAPVASRRLPTGKSAWPRSALGVMDDMLRSTRHALVRQPLSAFTRAPAHRDTLCAMHRARGGTSALDDINRAATRLHVSARDVHLSAVSGAVRAYLTNVGDDPATLRALRVATTTVDPHPFMLLARPPPLVFPLHIDVHERGDRLRRCAEMMARMRRKRLAGGGGLGSAHVLGRLAGAGKRGGWAHVVGCASLLFCDVEGPVCAVRIGGAEVSELYLVPPGGRHISVNIGMVSYDGGLFVATSGDEGRLSKPQELGSLFIKEMEALISLGDGT